MNLFRLDCEDISNYDNVFARLDPDGIVRVFGQCSDDEGTYEHLLREIDSFALSMSATQQQIPMLRGNIAYITEVNKHQNGYTGPGWYFLKMDPQLKLMGPYDTIYHAKQMKEKG